MAKVDQSRRTSAGANKTCARSLASISLMPASWVYGMATTARNWGFDAGWLRVHRVGVPTVCIGNLTVGGTGKTPMVEWVAMQLVDRGLRVCLLSRGYKAPRGRDRAILGLNDEGLVLANNLPSVPHLQNANRVAIAREAVDRLRAQVLVVDDGFQHRRLGRDLDIVLVDATNPFGGCRQLPAGRLREAPVGLRRASCVIITRADLVDESEVARIRERIVAFRMPQSPCPVLRVGFQPSTLVDSSNRSAPTTMLANKRVALVSGIGNPLGFERTVEGLGAIVVAKRIYADHHPFTAADARDLAVWSNRTDADSILTTQKDLVKLRTARLGDKPVWAVRIGVEFLDSPKPLVDMLDRLL